MSKPFFSELQSVSTSSALYNGWIEYAVGLTTADLMKMVSDGMTHQLRALRSMIREAIAGSDVDRRLFIKLDLLLRAANANAARLR